MKHIGEVIRARRDAMGLSLVQMSMQAGGSPAPSFINKMETDSAQPGSETARRLASVLRLPEDLMLNGFGLATPEQRDAAVEKLESMIGLDIQRAVQVPVLDPQALDKPESRLPTRAIYLRRDERAFIIENAFGEIVASRDREPRDGQAVIARVGNTAVYGTYRSAGRRKHWLITEDGTEIETPDVMGVVLRRTMELDQDDELRLPVGLLREDG